LHHEKNSHVGLEVIKPTNIESADDKSAGGGAICSFEPSNDIKCLSRCCISKEWTVKTKIMK
jgi:hypothetical protein